VQGTKLLAAILGMRLSVAFRKREFLTRSTGGASASGAWRIQRAVVLRHKATVSQRIEISRKEQKEQKNNECQPHQKFVIPDRSLTGSGIQGNVQKESRSLVIMIKFLTRSTGGASASAA
jgi:hypothetical protein